MFLQKKEEVSNLVTRNNYLVSDQKITNTNTSSNTSTKNSKKNNVNSE